MCSDLQPAVYRCIIPLDEPFDGLSATYHSLLNRKKVKKRPFPMWPEINDPYQPLCFPSLKRAIYFHYQNPKVTLKGVGEKIVEYWNTVVDREIKEQFHALVKSYGVSLEAEVNLGFVPRLIFASDFGEDFMRQLGDSGERLIE